MNHNFHFYKGFLTFILLNTLLYSGHAQNIVQNPGFEDYIECPTEIGDGTLECFPWQNGNCATTDYYNRCAVGTDAGVPDNWVGAQEPNSGDGYLGFICKWSSPDWQEFPQVELKQPCIYGYSYDFEFYLNLGDQYCGIEHIGVYFSKDPPPDSSYCGPLAVIPQFETNQGYLSDQENWVIIRGCFISQGGEIWLTIGNFHPQSETMTDPDCTISDNSYYFIDDVSVTINEEAEELDLDLGDPVSACTEYLIDPGIDNVTYLWSDGSRDPTLLVTESGTYNLTITAEGCSGFAIDSLEVTILGVPEPVEIGPAEVVFCQGESYEVMLDPNIGEYEWQDGSDDAEYTITTSGIYQVTFDDGCDESTDQISVTVVPPPQPFTLGPDEILCPGEELNLSFDPLLGDFLWQDDSTDPFFTITEEGTYSLTISNMCGEYVDVLEAEEIEPPVLDLDDDTISLCDGTPTYIEVDPDQGVYVWQDGSNETDYEIELPGTYFVTVTNECGVANDSVTLTLVLEPIFFIGPDQYLCPSQFPFLIHPGEIPHAIDYIWGDGSSEDSLWVETPGIYYLTVSNECFAVSDVIEIALEGEIPQVVLPPDSILCTGQTMMLSSNVQIGTYMWQDGSTASTFNVQSPGIYHLAVTNDCGTGTDTIIVDYIPPLPSPGLGPDLSMCPGEQIVLTSNVSNVDYLWQDGTVNDSLWVSAPGMYTLQISDQCMSVSDTIIVNANNLPPQVDLPTSLAICQGDSVTIHAGVSGVSYVWSDGSQNAQLTTQTPGVYSITVSNSCGSDVDSVEVIDNGVVPTVALGNDISFCQGESVLLSPVSTGAINWTWQDGSTAPTLLVSTGGQFAVTVSNVCGTAEDTLQAILLPATPPLDLGADTAFCSGFAYMLSIPLQGVDILWSNGSTNPDLIVTTTGLVSAEITNGCGIAYDTIEITSLPPAPILDLGIDQSLCVGETIIINPGLNNVEYLWQDGSTAAVFQTTQAGTIILTVSNDCGAATDTMEIVESTAGPQVSLGPDVVSCVGDTVILTSNISGVSFHWNDGSANNQLQVLQSGMYILEVSNLCGSDADSIVVDLSNTVPFVTLDSDTTVCEGAILILTANYSPGSQITWQDGSQLPSINVTNQGHYSVIASNLCGEDTDTLTVTYQYSPETFSLGPDTILCPGESITLTVPLTGYDILWQNGSQQSSIIADQDAVYTLTLSNDCGTSIDNLEVSLDQRIPVISLDEIYPWCEGDEITLDVLQPFPANYLWNDGSVAPSLTVTTPGVYSVEVSSDCLTVAEEVLVESAEPCNPEMVLYDDIIIPNVFSPNEDGINDVFAVSFGSDIQVLTIRGSIYDRWGNVLFLSETIPFTWDGKFRGEFLNPGVYVYTIQVKYVIDGREREEQLRGDVTIVR